MASEMPRRIFRNFGVWLDKEKQMNTEISGWRCAVTNKPARGAIKVDGSDQCDCINCHRLSLVNGAIGKAEADMTSIADELPHIADKRVRQQMQRVMRSSSEIAHALRQAIGNRPFEMPHTMDPDLNEGTF